MTHIDQLREHGEEKQLWVILVLQLIGLIMLDS
jgi:hypothetical protein